MNKAEIKKILLLPASEFLKKLEINDNAVRTYFAKRSTTFHNETVTSYLTDPRLSYKINEIKELVREKGVPKKIEYEDISTSQEEIYSQARTEREYEYMKGKVPVLYFKNNERYVIYFH